MKKIQHFIPRFILKNFLEQGKYKFFNKEYKKFSNKTPGGSMYKEYFYEHDNFSPNEIEDLLASRESVYAPVIKKIINQEPITLDDYKILVEFRHTTHYRSNEFIGFHEYKKTRGENDWVSRWDWKSLNSIYKTDNFPQDIKKSQLKAIQSVIKGEDAAFCLSLLTPLCFVFISKGKKFMVSDSGSLCSGNEFEGNIIIVISPTHAVMFPRMNTALICMQKLGLTNKQPTLKYEEVDNDFVDLVNSKVVEQSFEYYIDPNILIGCN